MTAKRTIDPAVEKEIDAAADALADLLAALLAERLVAADSRESGPGKEKTTNR